jgi:hypothetical protein
MTMSKRTLSIPFACALALLVPQSAAADEARPTPENPDRADAAPVPEPSPLTVGGYVEAFWQWHAEDPSNDITNYRGFDNRSGTFTLSNAVVDLGWDDERLVGKLALQIGHTPNSYYLAEPDRTGASGAGDTGTATWKFIQQAYAGYRFDVGPGVLVTAGLFLSPIGPEGMGVKDNWNWSRSNLFFGLPFYHTGLRATVPLSSDWTVTLAAYNGWNTVVDNNDEKSLSAQALFAPDETLALSLLYFTGAERDDNAPEGRGWRHLLDSHLTWHATPWLSLLAHANAGIEPTDFGTSAWAAGALYGRVKIQPWLFAGARGDAFYEHAASDASGSASPIFWPGAWVSSGTFTLDFRPHEKISFRAEYRHDEADTAMYFGGDVSGDGETVPYAANREHQNTVTLGMTGWY